ncbi:fibronectin type III domain-containing protein [Bacteroidales bacterium OttesenSCG-928-B11]|nr:fibronectin type III domain-containing protein [Bacteroidales bacterium OttesenSCG-928-E04]MDL2308136.1 fibronectin type III domain-containing protein [Bacteroidales bacterium OttesenSCG-928-C03]MDL2311509.1 fibronectin type III domain-containing protein [Bacteroidales bacterium OttesenSCG-928-B11]MDL2325562.1 fibronectin type III domain-containing protein [Bacteroidales bacterium OttesenSCG-928-A14]
MKRSYSLFLIISICCSIVFLLKSNELSAENKIVHYKSVANTSSCGDVQDLAVSHITGTSAFLTWNSPPEIRPETFNIKVESPSLATPLKFTTSDLYYVLSGLDENSSYTAQVFAPCDGEAADTASVSFSTPCVINDDVELMAGTGTAYDYPLSVYAYIMGQTIYTADVMGGEKTIQGISLHYLQAAAISGAQLSVYMGHTTESNFASTGDWIPSAQLQLVYTGTVNFSQGMNDILFLTPFSYNGTENVVICFKSEPTFASGVNMYTFRSHNAGSNATLLAMSEDPLSIASPPETETGSTEVDMESYRLDIRFICGCRNLGNSCTTPNLIALQGTHNSVDLQWEPNNAENSFELEYKKASAANWIATPVTTETTFTITGLDGNTHYQFRIRTLCDGDESNPDSEWALETFKTSCSPVVIPYRDNFENNVAGTAPDCWNYFSSNTSYPVISSTHSASSSNSLQLYADKGGCCIVASSAVTSSESIQDLFISFDAFKSAINYTVEIGVMLDHLDTSSFVTLATVTPAEVGKWERFNIPFSEYDGNARMIAFRVKGKDVANEMFIDNVLIRPSLICLDPINLTVNQVAGNSAIANWDVPDATSSSLFHVGISEEGTGNWNYTITENRNYIFSGLTERTTYDVKVYRACLDETTTDTAHTSFTTICTEGGDVFFNTGTTTNPYIPIYPGRNYSSSQSIFLQSEMGGATTIRGIDLELGVGNTNGKNNVKIYLGHVTESTFSDDTTWYAEPQIKLVYSGNLKCTAGVNTFMFDTAFQYNGTNNLVVCFLDSSGTAGAGNFAFKVHAASANQTLHYYSTAVPPSFNNPPSVTIPSIAHSTRAALRPNIVFYADCSATTDCAPANICIASDTEEGVKVSWIPGRTESLFELQYKAEGETQWNTETAIDDTTYTVAGLSSNAIYTFRIKALCAGADTTESEWREVTYRTSCGDFVSIPYSESFDREESGAGVLPNCWTRNSSFATYPHLSSMYANSGLNSLYLYAETGQYNIAVAPQITILEDIASMRLVFDYYCTHAEHSLEIGFMKDPNDISTYETYATIIPEGINAWKESIISFLDYDSDGRHLVFRVNGTNENNEFYIDNVVIESNDISCFPARDVVVSDIQYGSALVKWTPSTLGDSPIQYIVQFKADHEDTWNTVLATEPRCVISGLSDMGTYQVRVQTDCDGDSSAYAYAEEFSLECITGGDVSMNTGTKENLELPVTTYENYSISQTIFLSSEFSGGTTITGVALNYGYSLPMTTKNNVDIYMGHTTKSNFSNSTDWVAATNLQLVYSGPLNGTSSLDIFNFNTPFIYNGQDNLVICFNDKSGASQSNYNYYFRAHKTTSDMSIFDAGSTAYSITSPPAGYTYNERPNMIFYLGCDVVNCMQPNIIANNITAESADIFYVSSQVQENRHFEYQAAGDVVWKQLENPVGDFFTLTNLDFSTTYTLRGYVTCSGNDTSEVTIATFTTPCSDIKSIPFTEGFDRYGSGSTVHPGCWTGLSSGTNYPYVNNTAHLSGTASLFFNPRSTGYSASVLPKIDASINIKELEISFSVYTAHIDRKIEVGVMTDPEDISTYTRVELLPIQTRNTWSFFSVPLSLYGGMGRYIAIMVDGRIMYGSESNAIYVDDLKIDEAPDCPRPPHIRITAVYENSVTVAWDSITGVYGYDVCVVAPNEDPNLAAPVSVTDTFVTISDLQPNTDYLLYVRADCNDGIVGDWSMSHYFTASCDPLTLDDLPYVQGFDSLITGSDYFPECWQRSDNQSQTEYLPHPSYTHNTSAPNSLYFSSSATTYNLAVLPGIDGETINVSDLMLTFQARFNAPIASIEVGVMTNPRDISTFESVQTVTPRSYLTFEEHTVYFNNYTGAGRYIAIKHNSTYMFFLDDVELSTIPDCSAPKNISTDTITSNSVYISWEDAGRPLHWIIEYSDEEFIPGDGSASQIVANTNPFMLTDLDAGVSYTFYMRAYCGVADTSDYSKGVSFTTEYIGCDAPADLSITDIRTTTADITWALPGNAVSSVLEYKKNEESTYLELSLTETSHTLDNLTPGTNYDVRVKTICSNDRESGYATGSFTTARNTYIIIATSGPNGTIQPADTVVVSEGQNQTFTLSPDASCKISQVMVDNVIADPDEYENNNYTFRNVQANHAIHVEFVETSLADDYQLESRVLIYPNPAENILNVKLDFPFEKMEIVNIIGQVVHAEAIGELDFSVNISQYNAGVYFIKLTGGQGAAVKKFVKN